jgi:hypothetical protein
LDGPSNCDRPFDSLSSAKKREIVFQTAAAFFMAIILTVGSNSVPHVMSNGGMAVMMLDSVLDQHPANPNASSDMDGKADSHAVHGARHVACAGCALVPEAPAFAELVSLQFTRVAVFAPAIGHPDNSVFKPPRSRV